MHKCFSFHFEGGKRFLFDIAFSIVEFIEANIESSFCLCHFIIKFVTATKTSMAQNGMTPVCKFGKAMHTLMLVEWKKDFKLDGDGDEDEKKPPFTFKKTSEWANLWYGKSDLLKKGVGKLCIKMVGRCRNNSTQRVHKSFGELLDV